MPIKLGSTTASSFRVGSTAVSKVYIGSTSAWTSATAPGVPTSLSGSSGNAQVALTWTAPESDGGSAITDYAVQYSSDSGSTWSTFADGTSSSTGATVTGLDNGTAYVFRVAAVNAIGTGSYTSASSPVTPATTPGAPTSVSGTAGDEEVPLTWTAPASTGGSAITDYVVQYSSDSGTTWTTFSDGTSASTGATVTGLTNDTAYTFRVAAVNAVGTGSYSSASAAVTPVAPNPLLTDLVAFYKLSDNTDSSGNGYTLTETNVTYDTGKIGNSAVFDGTAYLSTSSLPSFASDMTLTLWFKITGEDSEDFLIGCGSSDGAFYLVRASGDVKSAVSGTGEVFAGGSGAADGNWHFAAVVRTGTTMKVWLDATSGSGSGTYSSINSPAPFKIGSNWDGTYLLMNGNIDAVGLWSRALSDAEIADMYASGSGVELP